MNLAVDVHLDRADAPLVFSFETRAVVTGVFGPSGAGKTSLLHLVGGLLAPTAGTIRVGDDVVFDRANRVDRPAHRRGVGIVFQDDRLFPHRSVTANLRYGIGRRPRDGARSASFDEIVRLLDLAPLLGRAVRHLSGGERQRIALGRALLAAPRILLLDEPLSSLDGGHKEPILALIARIRDELRTPMLYVSHDVTEILRLTDDLLVVDGGRSVAHGGLRDVARAAGAWRALRAVGAINVLPATVADHDEPAGLTGLTLARAGGGGPPVRLVGPLAGHAAGTALFVTIRPGDIALARGRVEGISIRNQLPGTVRTITRQPDRAIVEVDVGATLLVEVSHQTVREMELANGRDVWCLVKSNAVGYAGHAGHAAEVERHEGT